MNTASNDRWVRELGRAELPDPGARTGDLLPDGSVLLWRPDIQRMGLANFRQWLTETVLVHRTMIAVANQPAVRPRKAPPRAAEPQRV